MSAPSAVENYVDFITAGSYDVLVLDRYGYVSRVLASGVSLAEADRAIGSAPRFVDGYRIVTRPARAQ